MDRDYFKKKDFIFNDNEINYISVAPNTIVCDPTGAGDSFAGGMLGYIALNGMSDPIQAVIFGTLVASYTVSGFGLENLLKINMNDVKNIVGYDVLTDNIKYSVSIIYNKNLYKLEG